LIATIIHSLPYTIKNSHQIKTQIIHKTLIIHKNVLNEQKCTKLQYVGSVCTNVNVGADKKEEMAKDGPDSPATA